MYRKITSIIVLISMIMTLMSQEVFVENRVLAEGLKTENYGNLEGNDERQEECLVESPEAPGMMISGNNIQSFSASGPGKYQISVSTYLYVRSEPSANGSIIGSLNNGDVVWILETSGNWGRYSGGWISLNYANLIDTDTTGPTISNIRVTAIDNGGYNIVCDVYDDKSGISDVKFPTWTTSNQSDIIWEDCIVSGNTADCRINISSYNNVYGYYNTHIYATDNAGNVTAIATGFYYNKHEDEIYCYISYKGTDKVLGVNNGNVELQTKRNAMSQVWKLAMENDGSYKIINGENGKVLDVYCSSANAGANVQVDESNGSDAQRWYFYYGPNGEYRLRAKCTGCVLDVANGVDAEGTNLSMCNINNTSAQFFDIQKVDIPDYLTCVDEVSYSDNQLRINGWAIAMNGNIPVTYQIDDGEEKTIERIYAADVHNTYPTYPEGNERFKYTIPACEMGNGRHTIILRAYVNNQYEIKLRELTFESNAVDEPIISEKSVDDGKLITISSSTPEVDIYYTLDGSDPMTSSTRKKYNNSIALDTTGVYTVKAVGTKEGYGDSKVATADITLSKLEVPDIKETNGAAVISGTGTIYYTTDGTIPTTASNKYNMPFKITEGMIINAIAVQSGNETSEIATNYTVVYNLNEGTGNIYPQSVKKNTTANLRDSIPERQGYDFKGWSESKDAKAINYKQGDAFLVDKSLVLYAVWEKKTYQIKYNANGGIGEPGTQTKTYGDDLKLASAAPVKENYVFIGWTTNKTSNVAEYNPGDAYKENKDITLYAVWEKKTFTISYDACGGDNAPDEQYKILGETLTLTDKIPTKTGYKFLGWALSDSSSVAIYSPGGTYTIDAGMVLYAVWTPAEYSITLETNGGKINSGNVTSYLYLSGAVLPTDVSQTGCTFEGWYENKDLTGEKVEYIDKDEYGNKIYYAKWSTNPVATITYNYSYNGGTYASKVSAMAEINENVDLSPKASKAGWDFVGWNTNPNATSALTEYVASGNTTLYAIYKKVITANFYSCEYELQETKSVTIYNRADSGTVLAPNVSSYGGWYESGWRNDTSPADRMYNAGGSISIAADETFYAVYYRVLMLSYNSNGAKETPLSQTDIQFYNASVNKSSKVFTLASEISRDGYVFDKWAKNNINGEKYQAGATISIDNDTIMNATWIENFDTTPIPTPTPVPAQTPIPTPITDINKKPTIIINSIAANGNTITVSGKINNSGNWNMNNLSCKIDCTVGRNAMTPEIAINTDYTFSETITWTNGNAGMATIKAILSFEYMGESYEIESNVEECNIQNTSKKYIELTPKSVNLSVGEKTTLLVSTNTLLDYDINYDSIIWKSDNEDIVSVSNNGEIEAKKTGKANIRATIRQNGKNVASTGAEVVVSNYYIPKSFDFSEWNMYKSAGTQNTKNGWNVNDGNANKALAYLSRWNGVLNESDDPYGISSGNIDIDGKYHVQEAIFISPKASQSVGQKISDNSAYMRDMKSMLMTYGGIYASVYYDTDFFADDNNTYYFCPSNTKSGQKIKANHAITIVGWDDTIPKSTFANNNYQPRDNGGFICKNSYGANENDDGYFYISYDDVILGTTASTVFNNVESFANSDYNKIYQYDYLGATTAITLNSNDKAVYCANIFTNNTTEPETLKAVSTYAYNESERYNVYVIKNIDSNNDSVKKTLENSISIENLKAGGIIQYKGYYTIDLDEDVVINPGETFAVIIKLMNNQNAYFYIESSRANADGVSYYSNAKANDGESYVSRDGSEWLDCNSEITGLEGANVCVKAFTKTNRNEISIMGFSDEEDNIGELSEAIIAEDSGGLGDDVMVGASDPNGKLNYVFPDIYDLRDKYVTEVKDQGNYSSCWAFAAYGSLESCLLKKSELIDKSKILEGASEGEYINLSNQYIAVTGINIDENKKTSAQIIAVGDEKNVEARVQPNNATNKTVKWVSDDESILSVDEYGNISGVSTGIATLTAISVDGNYSDSFVVTVKEPTTDIYALELEQNNVTVKCGQRFIIDYIVRPLNTVGYSIEITSRNQDIVSVDENGILKANNIVGQAEIEVKVTGADDEYTEVCTVTVDDGMPLEISEMDNSLGIYSDMTFGGVSIDMKNKISETVNSNIYIAFYSSDGILLGLQKDSKELSVGNNKLEYNNLVINGKVETIKVFAWNSNMKPHSAIYETNIVSGK